MTTYYVDPEAAGSNNGTSWTHAWTTLQTAADTAVAGDIVYCRGTEELSAAIDFDTNSGTYNGGYIKFIGCNASGVNDGTQFVLNGQDNNINGIYINNTSYIWLENIKVHSCNATAGIHTASATADYWVFCNVWCHDNMGYGLNAAAWLRYVTVSRCAFTNNGTVGLYKIHTGSTVELSTFSGNGTTGLRGSSSLCIYGCCVTNNGDSGIYLSGISSVINCVVDGNDGHGVEIVLANVYQFIGSRITNNNGSGKLGISVGANCRVSLLGCYFGNNATDITANRYDIIPINGSTANVTLAGTETDHGYVTAGSDFNLDATKAANTRSIAIPLP